MVARRPLELVYYEACRSRADALRRERYLKSTWGQRYLRGRLKNYLKGSIAAPTTAAVRCTRSKWRSRRILLADASSPSTRPRLILVFEAFRADPNLPA